MKRKGLYALGLHATLALILLGMACPVHFAFVIATHTHEDAYALPPKLIPGKLLWVNVSEAWTRTNMGRLMLNSSIVAIAVAVDKIILSILAAFAFTHLRSRGRVLLCPMCRVTQMLPLPVRIVPAYPLMASFRWLHTHDALIIP